MGMGFLIVFGIWPTDVAIVTLPTKLIVATLRAAGGTNIPFATIAGIIV